MQRRHRTRPYAGGAVAILAAGASRRASPACLRETFEDARFEWFDFRKPFIWRCTSYQQKQGGRALGTVLPRLSMKSSLIPQSADDPDRFGLNWRKDNCWLNPVCSAFTMFKVIPE